MTDIELYRADFNQARDEVHQLHLLRFVWKNMLAMLQSQPELPHNALINSYLATTYTRTIAVGIRRQCESSGSIATIGSVLRRAGAHPELFTAASCGFDRVETWPGGANGWLRFAPSLNAHIDPGRVRAQITQLEHDRAVAKRWVDKRVAHLDRQDVPLTWDDLESALEGLRRATVFLHALLNAGGFLMNLTPDPAPGWEQLFAHAWFDPTRTQLVDAYSLG